MGQGVAVVQAEPRWQGMAGGFRSWTLGLVKSGAESGATLVVLPDLFGWATVGPALGLSLQAAFTLECLGLSRVNSERDLLACQAAAQAALDVYQEVAQASGVWLVGGSMPCVEGDMLYNATPVVAPNGRVQGWQRQTHLPTQERAGGLARGECLTVIDTGAGRLGILIGEDVLHPEVARILCLLGANVLVHQGAWSTTTQAQWMIRLWREVQANQVFGLESVLAGGGYRGRATVHAPCEMTSDRRGVIAQAKGDGGDEVVSADLDLAALQAVVDAYPIYDMLNEAMYRRYFPSLYESGLRQ